MDPNKTRLFDFIYHQQAKYPQPDCLASKVNGSWKKLSTAEVIDKSNAFSRGLLALGVKPGDKIALISNNRFEWNIADIGILQIGAIGVPVYPTISEREYAYIFNDAEVKYCFVSDRTLYNKVDAIRTQVASLKEVFCFEPEEGIKNWEEVLEMGKDADQQQVELLKQGVNAKDMATLIYTSGTTGNPKGVMLSHANIASNAIASRERLPVSETAIALSFLPVCHIYERMLIYLYTYSGVSIYYAESMDTIGENIREVKPHIFTAVPRLLEKVFDKIMAVGAELTGLKRKLFFWAVSVAEQYEPYGANGPFYELRLAIARKLIFKKWQQSLGGNIKAVASGSAPLNPRLARIFNAAGIPVFEGYGLTETSPVISVNCDVNKGMKIGTTGRPLKDVQVRIADDGEILVKGPNVMMGYYKKPEQTAEAIDLEGWFHTGDIGEMVDGQYLKITDRKKEMFKTSGGKYIAPQVMENKFKESRFIEQLIVLGESRKHPAALIVPSFAFVRAWAERKNIPVGADAELIKNPAVIARFQQEIDDLNKNFGHWEQIKKFVLLPKEFSIDGGELTPTLKLKRKEIYKKYASEIESIYATPVVP